MIAQRRVAPAAFSPIEGLPLNNRAAAKFEITRYEVASGSLPQSFGALRELGHDTRMYWAKIAMPSRVSGIPIRTAAKESADRPEPGEYPSFHASGECAVVYCREMTRTRQIPSHTSLFVGGRLHRGITPTRFACK